MSAWTVVVKLYPASELVACLDPAGRPVRFADRAAAEGYRDACRALSRRGSMAGGGPYYFVVPA